MKNRIEKESKSALIKITIELFPEQYAELEQMAGILGVKPHQVADALIEGQAEDYLSRQGEDIWGRLVEYIANAYGDTPRLRLMQQYIAACAANGRLPSIAERRVLGRGPLQSVEAYRTYLAKMTDGETAFDMSRRAA